MLVLQRMSKFDEVGLLDPSTGKLRARRRGEVSARDRGIHGIYDLVDRSTLGLFILDARLHAVVGSRLLSLDDSASAAFSHPESGRSRLEVVSNGERAEIDYASPEPPSPDWLDDAKEEEDFDVGCWMANTINSTERRDVVREVWLAAPEGASK